MSRIFEVHNIFIWNTILLSFVKITNYSSLLYRKVPTHPFPYTPPLWENSVLPQIVNASLVTLTCIPFPLFFLILSTCLPTSSPCYRHYVQIRIVVPFLAVSMAVLMKEREAGLSGSQMIQVCRGARAIWIKSLNSNSGPSKRGMALDIFPTSPLFLIILSVKNIMFL